MKPIRIRLAAVSVLAALGVAAAAPMAMADEAPTLAVTSAQEPDPARALQALLDSKDPEVQAFMAEFGGQDLAAFQQAAAAPTQPAGGITALKVPKWSQIAAALKKIAGFSKAVAGKYDDFKRWVDSRPWYVKYAIKAVSPGLSLYDIWWHFNH